MPLQVIVAGAGIGGLAVAAALARNGHHVSVFERAAHLSTEVGFAFRVTANSDRCLKYLGIDTVAGGAAQANTSRQLYQNGDVERELGENRDKEQVKKGVSVFASRPQIAKQLVDKATEFGVTIKTGARIERVDTAETSITLEDGTKVVADLIIGADGIYSAVRSSVVDTSRYKPRPTLNQNCFRFMVPQSTIRNDKVLSEVFPDEFRMVTWKGDDNDKRVVTYPVDFDSQYSIVCSHPAHLSNQAVVEPAGAAIDSISTSATDHTSSAEAVSYNKSVSLATVHAIYAGFDPRLHHLFDQVDPHGFRIWKLQDLEELPQWSVNRTVLIGDAAHAVLPFGFSGASMATEDAIVLAELLPSDVKVGDVPERLRLLERVRKPRVKTVREQSVAIGEGKEPMFNVPGDGGDGGGWGVYMRWLAKYDAVTAGRDALKEHLSTVQK